MECVVNEHGIAQVPALKAIPDFNLAQGLSAAREFLLEAVAPATAKGSPRTRTVGREERSALTGAQTTGAAAHGDHGDE
jgi:hypothetical protein